MRFWLIEAAAYWLEPRKRDQGRWLPFVSLVLLTSALEGIAFLWIAGGFRPL